MVEAETGIEANIPTLIWNKYKQSGWYQSSSLYDTFLQSILQHVPEHPIKETKFIANYAATNIVPSHHIFMLFYFLTLHYFSFIDILQEIHSGRVRLARWKLCCLTLQSG